MVWTMLCADLALGDAGAGGDLVEILPVRPGPRRARVPDRTHLCV